MTTTTPTPELAPRRRRCIRRRFSGEPDPTRIFIDKIDLLDSGFVARPYSSECRRAHPSRANFEERERVVIVDPAGLLRLTVAGVSGVLRELHAQSTLQRSFSSELKASTTPSW